MAENTNQMRTDFSASSLAIVFLVGCWLCALGGVPLASRSFSAKLGVLVVNILFVSAGLALISICVIRVARYLKVTVKALDVNWPMVTLGLFGVKLGLALLTVDLWHSYLGKLGKIMVQDLDYKSLGPLAIVSGIILVFLGRKR